MCAAAGWYKASAEAGSSDGQFAYGQALFSGSGTGGEPPRPSPHKKPQQNTTTNNKRLAGKSAGLLTGRGTTRGRQASCRSVVPGSRQPGDDKCTTKTAAPPRKRRRASRALTRRLSLRRATPAGRLDSGPATATGLGSSECVARHVLLFVLQEKGGLVTGTRAGL